MKRIDEFPTHEINGIKYRQGHPLPFGASLTSCGGGVNFSVSSRDAYSAELVLFHKGEKEPFVIIPFSDDFRIGSNFSMIVYGLDIEEVEYGYRFDGPYEEAKGYRFDKTKILLDPHAKLVSGRDVWGKMPDEDNIFQHRGKILQEDFDWQGDGPLEIDLKDLIIYEMHVRSFTAHPSSNTKYSGTYAAIIEKIPYLKSLGINCIELLPVFEFDEFDNFRNAEGRNLYNYWGYSTISFYSPKSGYARSGALGMAADEFKNLIKKLHQNGIEIILDVVFNHTAEGNENGPYISYKGIDNKSYYLLTPDGSYYNFSGCGNTMNCNASIVRNHILDCLRYWVSDYHVDGFRFDLASILSRDSEGAPMLNPPLLEELANDNILGKTKLIAEAWDAGGLYQVGNFPHWGRWAEWNGKFRDCVRRFIKSDDTAGPELIQRILGSPDLYGNRNAEASVNFVTCHDGFSMRDLVSYNEKHNEMNGEDNRDGANDNNSWNCGFEGETDDDTINSLRRRQIKNMAALMLISRGVPMLLSGDEMGNTQYGNNNAYCQDNEISWLDWNGLNTNKDIFEYFKKLIKLRREHPVLRRADFYTGNNSSHYPEVSFHGTMPWDFNAEQPFLCMGVMYAEPKEDYKVNVSCFIYCAFNAYWEDMHFELPTLPPEFKWYIYAYSADESIADEALLPNSGVTLMARSSMILIGR